MRNLARKHRPQKLEELYGQDVAINKIRQHMASGSNQSLLFVGGSGLGKTTAARILGATMLCGSGVADPCGNCPDCLAVLGGLRFVYGWYELDGGRNSAKEHMADIVRLTKGEHVFAWAAFIDEIHALQGDAADALLKAVEEPGPTSQFIAATTDLAAVRPALRNRCNIVRFLPLSGAQGFALLRDVCVKEAIRFEPKALDMIASASGGSARNALNMLDDVAWQGDVTPALVASTLGFGVTADLMKFFGGILRMDAAQQEAALYEWQAEPREKARLIRAFLLQLYHHHIASPALNTMTDPAFYQISKSEAVEIVRAIAERTNGRSLADFWLDLMDAWEFDPAAMTDHASLSIKARRFDRMVNANGAKHVEQPPVVTPRTAQRHPYRSRSAALTVVKDHSVIPHEAYLSRAQAEAIYNRASMLPQEYGVLFNTRIRIQHTFQEGDNEAAAAALVSQITHELLIRVSKWAPNDTLHWLYLHEACQPGMVTELVAHVPPVALQNADTWLRQRLMHLVPSWSEESSVIDVPNPSRATGYEGQRVARHWAMVRRLWRGLSPNLGHWDEQAERAPLANLLGVPRPMRGQIGALTTVRRISSSGTLGPSASARAQSARMTFLSAFADNAWHRLFDGWELREFADRTTERAARRDLEERIRLEWPSSLNRIEVDRCQEEIERLHLSWPSNPHLRARSWVGWW
jgi:DNA polymerase-3 subunit gamma/tau